MKTTQAHIVIGASYGDEGKGLITDGLTAKAMKQGGVVRVVRFNGGAQAGHTVETPDKRRHVFHHFGSGSLAGAATHLGQRFVVHPMLFSKERQDLIALGANVEITIDPRAFVTLPFDVMINQAIEMQRGHARHGSCGVGFGETVHRNETGKPPHRLTVGELAMLSRHHRHERWQNILLSYVPDRLAAHGLPLDAINTWLSDEIEAKFFKDFDTMLAKSTLAVPSSLMADTWILEGAQGLALDEDLGAFPYVTRSKTGLPWALEFLNQLSSSKITATVWYLTRAYSTRHGAGPFPNETNWTPPKFSDATNQPNDYQGSLRLAPLDPEALFERIHADLDRSLLLSGRVVIKPALSVSCLDQMNGEVPISDQKKIHSGRFARTLANQLGKVRFVESWGPTRTTLCWSSVRTKNS